MAPAAPRQAWSATPASPSSAWRGATQSCYPEGIDRRWNDGRNPTAAHDDVGFIRTLLDSLTRELPVDTTRIYAAGISNGAGMAYRLACDLPGRLAAVAAVAGAPAAGMEDRCGRTLPVSLIVFQGTHDPLMPYDGGITAVRRGQVLSAERTAALFASVNSCPGTALTSSSPTRRPTAPECAASATTAAARVVMSCSSRSRAAGIPGPADHGWGAGSAA